jgi:UDP-N-acetylmuramoyl-tripeptide--D-alanyl-D-alanine ligase
MPVQDIADGLSDAAVVTGSRMQMHERRDGVRVIDDAYNANPDSMRASLRALAAMSASGRRVAVVGEMRELGERSPDEHRAVGEFAASLRLDVVVGVGGTDAAQVADGAARGGAAARLVPDRTAAAALLDRMLVPGDLVLVKASRDVGLRALVSDMVPR